MSNLYNTLKVLGAFALAGCGTQAYNNQTESLPTQVRQTGEVEVSQVETEKKDCFRYSQPKDRFRCLVDDGNKVLYSLGGIEAKYPHNEEIELERSIKEIGETTDLLGIDGVIPGTSWDYVGVEDMKDSNPLPEVEFEERYSHAKIEKLCSDVRGDMEKAARLYLLYDRGLVKPVEDTTDVSRWPVSWGEVVRQRAKIKDATISLEEHVNRFRLENCGSKR
jgi:hypothetical protein